MADLFGPDGQPISNGSGSKDFNTQAVAASVIDRPEQRGNSPPALGAGGFDSTLIWFAASNADEIEPWGRRPKLRDAQLRRFFPLENIFSSALSIVVARNSGFSWKIEGASRTADRMQGILEEANGGRGWQDFAAKLTIDLASQDHGAFIETVRDGDSPDAPLIGINSLDAAKCWHSGDPLQPVIYQDRVGRFHILKWYQVVPLAEMPTSVEGLFGLQMCSLSCLLMAAQITRNTQIYRQEKSGGRNTRAMHLVKGFSSQALQDALDQMRTIADAQGFLRYMQPVLLGSHDPKADVGHDTIDFASLPDGWNEKEAFDMYINQVAMAFKTDRQEFAPLASGNLGSGAQSNVLREKSRGKGPALWMKLITHAMNRRILPQNVEFRFDEQDLQAEQEEAENQKLRAEGRSVRIFSREISPQEARQLALDAGDLPQELFDSPDETDPGTDVIAAEGETLATEGQTNTDTAGNVIADGQKALAWLLRGCKDTSVGEVLQSRIHRAFTTGADDLYALGYMNRDERITLSKIIGDVLDKFEDEVGESAGMTVARNVEQADLRTLMAVAAKASAEDKVGGSLPAKPFWIGSNRRWYEGG